MEFILGLIASLAAFGAFVVAIAKTISIIADLWKPR